MPITRIGAVAAHFGRDVERTMAKLAGIVESARRDGLDLLVLPGATVGGYIPDLRHPGLDDLPPSFGLESAMVADLVRLAGSMTLCVGFCEAADGLRYNAAVCVSGDGVLGHHRKVHQPAGEHFAYAAGDSFAAFDSPVGRIGLLIDYDLTFPEAARTLALDGARIIAALSAWPASVTNRAARITEDRQSRLFDLYDAARAAENQVVLASANQTGVYGDLRFLGQAKVVGPGGDVLSRTWSKGALARADLDVEAEIERARRVLHHLAERRPAAYALQPDPAAHR
ncbi:carbon-nitrogen hydrolase family protein [uncultured Friedmanniella sp.]|uniref:carbon-nitrogen hydrolase family protein n=1 Tax=uncultured Friedmanniella sp. TaxID=335381 RepID=UPI0035CC17F1